MMLQNVKIIALNIIAILFLSYFTLLSWEYINDRTLTLNNDYKTFYIALEKPDSPYYTVYYTHPLAKNPEKQVHPMHPFAAINMNSPTMNLLLKPIMHFYHDVRIDTLFFSLLSFTGALLGFAIAIQYLDSKNASGIYFAPLLLLFCFSWPSFYTMSLGQVGFLVLPFLSLGFLLDRWGFQKTATVMLALTASLKLFFLVFLLLYVVRRQWQLLAIFLMSFLFFFFLPLVYFSWKDYIDFYHIASNFLAFAERSWMAMNGSLLGVFTRLIHFFHIRTSLLSLRAVLLLVSIALIIQWVIYDTKYLKTLPEFRDALRLSFLILFALLLSPLGWFYYYIFLLIPVVVISKISERYALPITFFVLLSLALLFPLASWMEFASKNMASHLHFFGVFFAWMCWYFVLVVAAHAVHCGVSAPPSQWKKCVAIYIAQAVFSIALLFMHFAMPDFLSPVSTPAKFGVKSTIVHLSQLAL
ncbi:MAG: hypothetical protein A3B71_02525 [Gammaproteobacteria bacterium RIFCSPHIGHO2_02_FULL_42_43]|nr:MAG: hypothetical protein A3B71_02525 [Gammaproteobacteria bacterium RIFCSPHIGHO2_02_FULL_42_43]